MPIGSQLPIGSQYALYERKKKKSTSGKPLEESFLGTIPVCNVVTDLDESKQESTLVPLTWYFYPSPICCLQQTFIDREQ